LNYFADGEA